MSTAFWNALAPHHAAIEDNYFDLASLHNILDDVVAPALVVGAGQGLIVEALRKHGRRTDGLDLNPRMIEFAARRRSLSLIEADAAAMPFGAGAYRTVIVTTGVVDFVQDEQLIKQILTEARRVANASGTVFVAFYRMSDALEAFSRSTGLLEGTRYAYRETMQSIRYGVGEALRWTAQRAGVSLPEAVVMGLTMELALTKKERRARSALREVLRAANDPDAFLATVPETLPYRNEQAIKQLLEGLGIPLATLKIFDSCFVARLAPLIAPRSVRDSRPRDSHVVAASR